MERRFVQSRHDRAVVLTLAAALVAVLASAAPAAGQVTAIAGVAYTVEADHDGLNTIGYQLYVNSSLVAAVPVSSLVAGVVAFPNVVFTPGDHAVEVCAYNDFDRGCSAPLAVTTTPPANPAPTRPGLPRLTPTTATYTGTAQPRP